MLISIADRRESRLSAGFALRRKILLGVMLTAMTVLVARATYLQIFNTEFLQDKGHIQHVGEAPVPAYRGQIRDRNGEPLAISTPVMSIWLNPRQINKFPPEKDEKGHVLTPQERSQFKADETAKLGVMAKLLGLSEKAIKDEIKKDVNRRFVYIKRQINPDLAEKIAELKIVGVYFDKEFKRYYPAGPISGHLLGFTDIDDVGQEGIERGYEQVLRGKTGTKRVIKDGKGQVIKDVEIIDEPIAGHDLALTIDQRLQYLAYRELQSAMLEHKAKSAALVILDAKSGDVLAAVSQPSFNPNNRKELNGGRFRNRPIVDTFEPGSTVKPFVVAAALDGGYVDPNIRIETHGVYHLGRNVVKDVHNYGTLDLTHVLKKSSNIAVVQLAMGMPKEYFWGIYNKLGFGNSAGVGFPGEASGALTGYERWREFDQAALSFGYGVSTSVLQLARAYTALADDGIVHSVSLLKREEDPDAQRVFKASTARKIREMLETVTEKDGTAFQARVEGYRVAGKTGTAKKATAGGYAENRYFSVFVGIVPASKPRFVTAIMIDEPSTGEYYGGLVAAPVFSKVMAGALRVYGVAPDGVDTMPLMLSGQ